MGINAMNDESTAVILDQKPKIPIACVILFQVINENITFLTFW